MPSGPKKRKAAKKKMEIHQNDQPNTSSASVTYHGAGDEIEGGKGEIGKEGDVSNPSQVERNVVVEAEIENECMRGDEKDGSSSSSSSSAGESDEEESYDVHAAQDSVEPPVNSVNSADSLSGRSEVFAKIENLSDSAVDESPPLDSYVKKEEIDTISPVHKSVVSYSVTIADHNQCTTTTHENEDRLRLPQSELDQVVEQLMVGPAQRTSWKSCCGLFQVFTESVR